MNKAKKNKPKLSPKSPPSDLPDTRLDIEQVIAKSLQDETTYGIWHNSHQLNQKLREDISPWNQQFFRKTKDNYHLSLPKLGKPSKPNELPNQQSVNVKKKSQNFELKHITSVGKRLSLTPLFPPIKGQEESSIKMVKPALKKKLQYYTTNPEEELKKSFKINRINVAAESYKFEDSKLKERSKSTGELLKHAYFRKKARKMEFFFGMNEARIQKISEAIHEEQQKLVNQKLQ